MQEREDQNQDRNPVHKWLEQERDSVLQRYEVERARELDESMDERQRMREARRSGDQQAIDLTDIDIQRERIARLRDDDARRLQDHGVREQARQNGDRLQERLQEFERVKQAEHDRLEQNPHEREEHERLQAKARKMLPSRHDMQRLKQSWDVTLYTLDRRPMQMTYREILQERMDRIRAREQEQAREQDRKEREREERDRIRER